MHFDSVLSFVVDDVAGFTYLDNRVYVVYDLRQTIHVFAADTFSEVSVITVNGLKDPLDIVASHDDHCLYVSDWFCSIWRVSAVNPTDCEKWLTVGPLPGFYAVSLTSRRLLLTSPWSHCLHQYSTVNKELLRVVLLPRSLKKLTHAVETSRGTFVVSHSQPHSAVGELLSLVICLVHLHQ